jgi:hypothetical protein
MQLDWQLAYVLYLQISNGARGNVKLFGFLKVNIQQKSLQTILSFNPNPSHAASQL